METRSNPTGQASLLRPSKDRISKNFSPTLDPVPQLAALLQLVVLLQAVLMQVLVSPNFGSLLRLHVHVFYRVCRAIEKKAEKPKEEEPEEDVDMGGLFGDDY